MLSEAAKVKRILDEENHDRWGFAVYRCTYGDDLAWDQCKNIITTRAREDVQRSNHPEILDTFDCLFFDDCENFDNATAAVLREHFDRWKSDNAQREQPRAAFPLRAPRYQYFIRVDREALDGILSAPSNPRPGNAGWVHFVQAEWIAELDEVDSDTEDIDMPNLDFEPVEGCREESVGWMKVPADSIYTELYALLDGHEMWRYLYRRPPEMATI